MKHETIIIEGNGLHTLHSGFAEKFYPEGKYASKSGELFIYVMEDQETNPLSATVIFDYERDYSCVASIFISGDIFEYWGVYLSIANKIKKYLGDISAERGWRIQFQPSQ